MVVDRFTGYTLSTNITTKYYLERKLANDMEELGDLSLNHGSSCYPPCTNWKIGSYRLPTYKRSANTIFFAIIPSYFNSIY